MPHDVTPRFYEIPAQPLSDALRQLAKQSSLQLFFDASIADGKQSEALQGEFKIVEAVHKLLINTGLTYQFLDSKTLVIKRAPKAPTKPQKKPPQRQASATRMSEIVVTGRKREENLQEVPLSITALTSSNIEEQLVMDMRNVSNFVPGFEFLQTATREFERPVIRGQSTVLSATESGVATFIDGLSFHSAVSTLSLKDIERIEIIKGPQSALHGRNTYAGAISITSKKPSNEPELNVAANLGQFHEIDLAVGASGPLIGDKLSAGLQINHYEYGGEHRNQLDGRKIGGETSDSFAVTVSYTPTPSFRLVSRLNYGRDDDDSPPMYLTPDSLKNIGFEQGGDEVAEFYKGTVPVFPVNLDRAFVDDPGFNQERYWASARADWDISDRLTFTSITGYEESEQAVNTDSDLLPTSIFLPLSLVFTPADPLEPLTANAIVVRRQNREDQETWQQELRLAYDSGNRVRALAGIYYYDDAYIDSLLANSEAAIASQQFADALANLSHIVAPRTIGTVNPPPERRRVIWRDTKNWALFGKIDLDLGDEFTVTLEGRYQEEKLNFSFYTFSEGAITFRGGDTFRSFLPRATLEYSPNDDHLFYVVAANGSKPGGVNDDGGFDPLVGAPTFDEETIWSFEAGTKNVFPDLNLILNSAVYFNRISDLQFTESVAQSDSTSDTVITNNGNADIWGVELQASYYPEKVEGLGLQFSFAYNDSRLGDQVTQSDQGILNDILDDGFQNCSLGDADPRPNRCKSVAATVGGNRLPRSSKYQAVAGVTYEKQLSAKYDWFATADYAFNSSQYVSAVNIADYGEASLVNLSFGIRNERMKLSIWGKNVTDEDSALSVINFINASSFENTLYGTLRRGRQFGLSISYRW